MQELVFHEGILSETGASIVDVTQLTVGRCRGCLQCRYVGNCINYQDDAQKMIARVCESEMLTIHLAPEMNKMENLVYRMLYGIKDGKVRQFKIVGDTEGREAGEVCRLLKWCGYKEV